MDYLWNKIEQGAQGFVRTYHHFADGQHSCHGELDYPVRIRDFLEKIFKK
jgi:hypothetical protein